METPTIDGERDNREDHSMTSAECARDAIALDGPDFRSSAARHTLVLGGDAHQLLTRLGPQIDVRKNESMCIPNLVWPGVMACKCKGDLPPNFLLSGTGTAEISLRITRLFIMGLVKITEDQGLHMRLVRT